MSLWISQTFHNIYISPMDSIRWAMFLLPACWLVLSSLAGFHNRTRRVFCFVCLLFSIAFVLVVFYMTVIRRGGGTHEVFLIPFYSLQEAKRRPEFYRQLTMNVFLFEPLGCAAPFATEYVMLSKIRSENVYKAASVRGFQFCAGFSLLIEACQGIFGRGRVETDDVIMNLLGALIGIGCYVLQSACLNRRESVKR